MRCLLLLLFTLPGARDLGMINQLDECVQLRFQTLQADAAGRFPLGMSRVMAPPSMGRHFVPRFVSSRDFWPENLREREVLARLEDDGLQVGFYLFGRAILEGGPELRNPRALKGPGAVTQGTPRAKWYPGGVGLGAAADALPDWRAIYPLARRAMRDFCDGRPGFETAVDSWRISARPVLAGQDRCLSCHGGGVNSVIGGVFYAYRRAAPVGRAHLSPH